MPSSERTPQGVESHANAADAVAQGTSIHGLATPYSDSRYRYESDASEPDVLKKSDRFLAPDEADRMLEACQAVARRARDCFKEACESEEPDEAETSYLAAKDKLEELRGYAHLRDRVFRDLLMLVLAAVKFTNLHDITPHQRDILRTAFADLPVLFLDSAAVERHIGSFADAGMDQVLDPIRPPKGKRLKVTIEEAD
jgi:hypothetical protein